MVELRLLGAPYIEISGQEARLPYRKAMALLAYLAVTSQPHSREQLASLLWGEVDDGRARNSLRSALSVIRRATAPVPILETHRDMVTLYADRLWLDVAVFKAAIRNEQSITGLTDALATWRGHFLDGLTLDSTPEFDDWLTATRNQLDRLHQDGWLALSRALEATGQWSEAIEAAQRLLAMDPLREAGHRQLMRLYLKDRDRSAALQQYEQCRALLAEELGVAPDARTQALHLQALAERTPAHLIGDQATGTKVGQTSMQFPFVGRKRELAALNRHLQEVTTVREGRLVLAEGEAGVGKTRLMQEWLTQVRGAQVLVGRCFEAERSVPYHPWIDVLRASLSLTGQGQRSIPDLWMAELARLVPELRAILPDLPDPPAPDPGLVRGRLAEAARQWLLALSREQPLCLLLDDLQWIDHASLALLEYILRHSTNLPLLILGAQRTPEVGPDWQRTQAMLVREGLCHRLELYRLAFPDVVAMAHTVEPRTADPEAFFKRLFRETEGNPLFVVEILRTLQRLDVDLEGEWPIPSTIQGVIHSRLDRLAPETRRLLRVAAVIGPSFDYQTLETATGHPSDVAWKALEEGLAAGLVEEQESRFHFTHDKIRAVLYADSGVLRRRHLHSRVAEALETLNADDLSTVFSLLAHHFAAAGEPARARDYALRAAQHAVELYADEDALAEYERAAYLSESEKLPDELPVRSAREVVPFYTPTDENKLPVGVLCLIHNQRGLIYQRIGRYADAEREFNLALEHAVGRNRPDEEATAQNLLSFLSYLRGDYDGVATHAQQAIDRAIKAGDASQQATGLKNLGIVAYQSGDYDRALDLYYQALTIYETVSDRLGMGACYNNIGFVQNTQGDFGMAIESFEQALALREELGQIEGQAVHLMNIGRVYTHQKDIQQAHEYLQRAQTLSEEINAIWVTAKVHRILAELGIMVGDWETALKHARTAADLAQDLGSKEDMGAVFQLLGEIAAGCPDRELGEPTDYFERGIALLEEVGEQHKLKQAQQTLEEYRGIEA